MLQNPFFQIKNYLKKSFFIQESAIKPHHKFEQLGLNFMEFNEVVVQLENSNQINIPDALLIKVRTVGDLVDLINFYRINQLNS